MLNQVQLIGNLGRDPELKEAGNTTICNLSLATTFKWKAKDGERKEKTEWHRVVLFGKTAEVADKYLSKGSKVYIQGRLQNRKWEDKNGETKYITEIVGENLIMLDGKKGSPEREAQKPKDDTDDFDFGDDSKKDDDEIGDDDIPY